jgi:hypothetical protein
MALMRYEIVKLAQLIEVYGIKNCLSLGVQSLLTNLEQVKNDFIAFNISFDHDKFEKLMCIERVNALDVLETLDGIENIDSMDCSDYEGANIIFDLNKPVSVNPHSCCYDLVIDGGTLEHVYNVSNAINNMNCMVAEGGIIYHMLPCSGWVNHGFYSFSPCFFEDTYVNESGFELIENFLCLKQPRGQRDRLIFSADCRFMNVSEINQLISEHSFESGVCICCIARKKSLVPSLPFEPMQGMYRNDLWNNSKTEGIDFYRISQLFEKSAHGIYIYGAGDMCKQIMQHLAKENLVEKVNGIFDSNKELDGIKLAGKTVKHPSKECLKNAKIILIGSLKYENDIETILKSKKYSGRVVKLSEL